MNRLVGIIIIQNIDGNRKKSAMSKENRVLAEFSDEYEDWERAGEEGTEDSGEEPESEEEEFRGLVVGTYWMLRYCRKESEACSDKRLQSGNNLIGRTMHSFRHQNKRL